MPFVVRLLCAMVRLDAEALVLCAGDVPYIVGPSDDRHEIGARALPKAVVVRLAQHLLPLELQAALDDVGEIKYELPEMGDLPGQQFTVTGAIGRTFRVEIHRRRFEEALVLPPADSLWPAARGTEGLVAGTKCT